ncbi:YceI family protein [Kineococcus radiotolerans SRS30216 = ATCC BAA-149]|uniref:YceI family protein n=1 Tax=Kineococcus radiotolerans (strain ATCC BAA-149 / DSM 14245 / SRS30216) TaxID=266940 RepID=A6WDT8_KINRD|nr:YceI family protein [Kineococcus radiotolerans]ABS04977.1 YceI family protein [Kineococcus radiotolerans SRS30216 = ATCC BAA-149]
MSPDRETDLRADPAAGAQAAVTGEGRVLTREGWPVTGASVTLLGADGSQVARAVTGGDGTFTLLGVPAGAATMLVAAPAHDPRATSVVVPAAGAWSVGEVRLRRQGGSDVPPPGVWAIDVTHSTISATAHHLGLSAVHGRFTNFSGVVTVPEDVTRSTVQVEIDATSIDTGNAQRDEHLRSPDFLDTARFPTLTFSASGVQRGAEGWVLAGDLTLLGTTRPVQLQLSYAGSGPDPWGGTRAAFSATTELHRDDFKMNWNQAVGIGVAVFGTTLKVAIDVQTVLQQ